MVLNNNVSQPSALSIHRRKLIIPFMLHWSRSIRFIFVFISAVANNVFRGAHSLFKFRWTFSFLPKWEECFTSDGYNDRSSLIRSLEVRELNTSEGNVVSFSDNAVETGKNVRREFDMPNCRMLRKEPGEHVTSKTLPPADNFQSLRGCEEPIKGKGWKVFCTREKINWISNSQLCYFTTEKKGEFENNSKGMKIKQKLILSIKIIKLEAEMKICRKVGSSKNGNGKILINPRNSKISIKYFFLISFSSLYLILCLW